MSHLLQKSLAAVVLANMLASCGTPPKLEVSPSERYVLVQATRAEQSTIKVLDVRPAEQRAPARFGGYFQLGDLALEPSPQEALERSLETYGSSSEASESVRQALRSKPIELVHFQVLAVNKEVESGFRGVEHLTPPGVLAIDALLAALRTSTVGASRVRIVVSFDIGNHRFSSDESITFTASPETDAPAQVLTKALRPIYRRLEIAFTAPK